MKKWGIVGLTVGAYLALIVVGVWITFSQADKAPAQSVADFWRNTVKLESDRGYGTGFEGLYKGKRVILTAGHVVEGITSVRAVDEDEGFSVVRDVRVVRLETSWDLALLVADNPSPRGYVLPDLTPTLSVVLNEAAYYPGYGADTRNWLEQTTVARPQWAISPYQGFIVTGKGWYGSSGSAVVVIRDGRAVLAGVLCCSAASERGSSDVHAFAPSGCQGGKVILDFLERATYSLP